MQSRTLKIVGGLATLGAAASLLGLAVFIFAMLPLSEFRAGRAVDWSAQITIPSIGVRTWRWVVYVTPLVLLCIGALVAFGSVLLLRLSHIRHAGLATVLVMLVTVSLSSYLFCYTPSRPGYLGAVSVKLWGFQTNAAEKVTALVTVSNAGSYALELPLGCQVMIGESEWTGGTHGPDGDPVIEPGGVSYVSVVTPSEPCSWRVQAHCVKYYPQGWSGRMNLFMDAYVFKRQVWETVSTPEIYQ